VFFAAELLIHATTAAAAPARADNTAAVYWQPPDAAAVGADARAAFSAAAAAMGARFVDATPAEPVAPSLVPALDAAKSAYARFAFRDAITALDALQRDAHAAGGGDLDGRQLSEMFLYRGLAKLEGTAGDTAAWDDLVNAARLDPTRVLDPARFPPRAVATYKRAAAEAAQLPRADLVLEVPPDAAIRIDGAPSSPAASVTMGQHLVSVTANGFERWAAAVSVASDPTRFKPPIHPHRPPPVDRIAALAGVPGPQRLLVGVLERASGGWTFTVRDIPLPDGRIVSDSVALGDVPTRAAVAGLVRRMQPTPSAEPRRRWMPWVLGACAAALVTTGIVFAVSADASPNVAGELGRWR